MTPTVDALILRSELLARRDRLESALQRSPGVADARRLLDEVDAALRRMDDGSYGLCDVCGERIEPERLLTDPLVRVCVDHVDESERCALDRDLELAVRIQRRLLPRGPIVCDGWETAFHYRPAGAVSGDYCDVVSRESTGLFFVMADVSGKGVAASLLMSHLHAIVHTLLAGGEPVVSLLAQANRLFCESTLTSHYATGVFGVAHADGTVIAGNAGHWPPLIVRGDSLERLEPSGLPLGFTCSTQYGERTSHLEPGDAMVLYTDGLIEARNEVDDDYGEARLSEVLRRHHGLPPDAMVTAVLRDVEAFLGSARLADDLTILVLRRSVSS
jgi:sigma-B regulation protein RsbU (phosphoserine phosphatase)